MVAARPTTALPRTHVHLLLVNRGGLQATPHASGIIPYVEALVANSFDSHSSTEDFFCTVGQ